MKMSRKDREPSKNNRALSDSDEGIEFVGLASVELKKDDAEVQAKAGSDPASDSPGDDAILEQEELYEGLSSDRLPSEKTKEN
jgi:hypothetical protein